MKELSFDEIVSSKKVVWKVALDGASFVTDDFGLVQDTILNAEPGEKFTVEVKQMNKREYDSLQEFQGF